MKSLGFTIFTTAAIIFAQANAQTVLTDADGNGVYTLQELVDAYPDLTEEAFKAADRNADDALDAAELAAAIAAGQIPG